MDPAHLGVREGQTRELAAGRRLQGCLICKTTDSEEQNAAHEDGGSHRQGAEAGGPP